MKRFYLLLITGQIWGEISEVRFRLDLRAKYRSLDLEHSCLELRALRLFHEGKGYGSLFLCVCFSQKCTEWGAIYVRIDQQNVSLLNQPFSNKWVTNLSNTLGFTKSLDELWGQSSLLLTSASFSSPANLRKLAAKLCKFLRHKSISQTCVDIGEAFLFPAHPQFSLECNVFSTLLPIQGSFPHTQQECPHLLLTYPCPIQTSVPWHSSTIAKAMEGFSISC